MDDRGNVPYFDNPGMRKYGQGGDTISRALLRAAEGYTINRPLDANGKLVSATTQSAQTQTVSATSSPTQAAQTTTTQVIRIDLNGKSTNIGVASAGDAAALKSILQQLATAKGSAL